MRVEVLNTGTELLLGSVINTHVRLFAEALFPLGLRIERQVTVPDGDAAIRGALLETFGRAEIVLITGGLGPTTDDVTREIVAEMLGEELVEDAAVLDAIRARFARRNLFMSPRNARQAQRPREATVLVNNHGTAPGLYLAPRLREEALTPHLFLLPGPPRELKPMFAESVLPILRQLLPASAVDEMRVVRLTGIGESNVEEIVGASLLALGLELGYCARPGEVDIRTIGQPAVLDAAERIIAEKLGPHILTRDQRTLEAVVVDRLIARQETVAVAESCTGGFLAHRLTNVPGASAAFLAGYITYANAAKVQALGVDPAFIEQHGAVSEQVARAMAEGALRQSGAHFALATTGIAGPGGGSAAKPVGTVFIALTSTAGETLVQRQLYPTDREAFKQQTTQAALNLLRQRLA